MLTIDRPRPRRSLNRLRSAQTSRIPALALNALSEGDFFGAFALSDRWCRVGAPNVPSLLLRAEASNRLGDRNYAFDDIQRALELDPVHRLLNLRMLEWGDVDQRLKAAKVLVNIDQRLTERCLCVLADSDLRGVGAFSILADRVTGWAAWRTDADVRLVFEGAWASVFPVEADPAHTWSRHFGHAVEFEIPLPETAFSRASLLVDDIAICQSAGELHSSDFDASEAIECTPATITVIIPVFEDFEATRACLNSVEVALKNAPGAKILVIDDASPNEAIKRFLTEFKSRPDCHVRSHAHNKGYVASINDALRLVAGGDVILLNSDTVAPPDFIWRLARIASSDPSIGTINPLSNNGEFVSFPKPYANNNLDVAQLPNLNAASCVSNLAETVDIPSGTGFCLYVARACLDAIGGLSSEFKNGYLEDADFGLRAREAGFRNVCAPSIFVAHLGSRSFRFEKVALVARNRKTLARRFPAYEAECDAFIQMNPLNSARSKIEQLHNLTKKRRFLIGPKRLESALRERAHRLDGDGVDSLLILFQKDSEAWKAILYATDSAPPQNVTMFFDQNFSFFFSRISHWPWDRVELAGLTDLPEALCERIFDFLDPVDLLIVECGLGVPVRAASPAGGDCMDANGDSLCEQCRGRRRFDAPRSLVSRWRKARAKAASIIPLDAMTSAACRNLRGAVSASPGSNPLPFRLRPIGDESGQRPAALGVLLPHETPEALRLLLALGDAFEHGHHDVFILGKTSIDEKLIAKGLFVTGAIKPDEIGRVVKQYRIGRYFLPYRSNMHWALERYRYVLPAPAAYFNWAPDAFKPSLQDLSLSPHLCDRKTVSLLGNWL